MVTRLAEKEYGKPACLAGQDAVAAVTREAELHARIMAECRARGWFWSHGSMAHRTLRTLGEPDFYVFGDRGRSWLVECKRPGGKLRLEQEAVRAHLRKLGHAYHVVTSLEEFLTLVR